MLNALDTETEAMAGRKRLEGLTAIVTGSTSGIGLGIDRLVMLFTGAGIRETILFPLLKPEGH